MQTVSIEVFDYSELSETAKEKARYDWLSNGDFYHRDGENRQSLEEFENHFPVDVKNWSYGGDRGDGIDWTFTDDDLEEMKGVRLYKYLVNNYSDILGKDCPFTNYCADESLLDPIRAFVKRPNKHEDFYNLMSECLNNWVSQCTKDYEYAASDEAFAENCEANEWQFTEYGSFLSRLQRRIPNHHSSPQVG